MKEQKPRLGNREQYSLLYNKKHWNDRATSHAHKKYKSRERAITSYV